MATGFMSRPKAVPSNPREALAIERIAPDLVAKRAEMAALAKRRDEETAKAAELTRAVATAEQALADLEISPSPDDKAIAQARKALERLTQDLTSSRLRGEAYGRAFAIASESVADLQEDAFAKIAAVGRPLHEAAVVEMARAFRATEAAISGEEQVRHALMDACRAVYPDEPHSREKVGRFIRPLGYRFFGKTNDPHGGALVGWFREAAEYGYPIEGR